MTYFVERDLPWTLQKMYLAQWKTYKIYYREYRQMLFKKLLENQTKTLSPGDDINWSSQSCQYFDFWIEEKELLLTTNCFVFKIDTKMSNYWNIFLK